ncbi:condensin complex subunit 2/barren [Kockovaella imperatae]|uniref:Condensin complex subunit 2 n=1 Tax=Kockovaella imperatae TaxID=4999 RepID=A0A1Y1U8U1_9TREE|nr:condensin complex subunit 2/barren [Kockovaella imperatae]ORX34460.1 condensin complex subunit 2/barren [Kockovaella imperatae]
MDSPITSASPGSAPLVRRKSALKKSYPRSSVASVDSITASPLQPSRSANLNTDDHGAGKMNDDVAEKAARRKSAHFGELGHGNVPGGDKSAPTRRVISALAVQAQQAQQAALGNSAGPSSKRRARLSAVTPAAPVVSMEVMNTNFEEWMKLATDNKITATNTWNFALIDYFADLTLLRNDEDQSINFQKASCTLDGCVKIWTSRVDSVATETGKLLSGLAGGGGVADDDEAEEAEEDEEGVETRKSRKTARSEATLAKTFAALQVKKFDLEFTVDPLFKKTSADFDEGGAMGLLMNHLGVDGKGRVVFDAGDAGVDNEEDEALPAQDAEDVDLTKLRAYIPEVGRAMELNISDTLSSFKFSANPEETPDLASILGLKDTWDEQASMSGFGGIPAPTGDAQDFFGGEDFDMGGGLPGAFDDAESVGGFDRDHGEDEFGGAGGIGVGLAGPGDQHGPFDPRRQGQGELVMALMGDGDEEGMFDYFDKGFGKAWAGAEHWKLRRVAKRGQDAAATTTRAARVAKTPFSIDFSAPSSEATSSKTLFAPASSSSLLLPSSSRSRRKSNKRSSINDAQSRREEWLLPDDMHFSSRQLLSLFLKPKFALRMRRNANRTRLENDPNGEIDENFWAQAAADRIDIGEGDVDTGDSAAIPFESQFFHDDVDDGFADDGIDMGTPMIDGDDDDLWQGTQGGLRKSRPENVNYAKKAKRVDVKRLKDDIWSGLKTLLPKDQPDSPEDEPMQPTTPAKSAEQGKTFDGIIQDLRTTYPSEKMSEISTSFCFICLLHLANEEGLRIETARFDGHEGEDVGCQGIAEDLEEDEEMQKYMPKKISKRMDEGERSDRVVGELQALKVFKDPNAGRAA